MVIYTLYINYLKLQTTSFYKFKHDIMICEKTTHVLKQPVCENNAMQFV